MAAADHLHPEQLKMFMSAREIMSGYDPHEGDRLHKGTNRPVFMGSPDPGLEPETNSDMWDRKLAESKDRFHSIGKPLYEKLEKEGVKDPIPLTTMHYKKSRRPMVGGGQHRIAAMNDIDPDALMPVIHHRSIIEAKSSEHYPYT